MLFGFRKNKKHPFVFREALPSGKASRLRFRRQSQFNFNILSRYFYEFYIFFALIIQQKKK